jgi:hypothetical protein
MWEFAKSSPGFTFLIVWVLAWAAVQPFKYAFQAYNRRLRSANILAHGWPTAAHMDADGDLVYPKCKCEDETQD